MQLHEDLQDMKPTAVLRMLICPCAVQDMKPTAVLRMIAEPLDDESASRRQHGLKLLLQVLAGEGAVWTATQREEYLTAARPHMTADEQVLQHSLCLLPRPGPELLPTALPWRRASIYCPALEPSSVYYQPTWAINSLFRPLLDATIVQCRCGAKQ